MRFLLISVIAFLAITANCQTITFSGNISTNTTWNADTVQITGDVIIDNQATLTINEGTYIEFMAHYMIYVQGTILANGSENNLITLTISDTTGYSNELDIAGSWYGIKFINTNASNDSSKLSFCKIEFVKDITYQDSLKPSGAISLYNFSKLQINNCIISNNKAENEFPSLGKGGAIAMFENSNPIIKNNTFFNNIASGEGGAIYCEKSNPNIISNIFRNNIAGNSTTGAGGAINLSYCDDIYTYDTIVSVIANNLIYNNSAFEGGAIFCYYSSANYTNNTICNNFSEYGGALYSKKSHPMNINSIFYNNSATEGSEIYINHDASVCTPGNDPNFINCNLQGGVVAIKIENDEYYGGTYENNSDIEPLFIDEANNDYKLQNLSPMINKGKSDSLGFDIPQYDLAGNTRIFNDTIDLGAYENQHVTEINYLNNIYSFKLYPNPTSNFITIETIDINKIEIYNSVGKLITVANKLCNKITIDVNSYKKGIYYVKTSSKLGINTQKLIIE